MIASRSQVISVLAGLEREKAGLQRLCDHSDRPFYALSWQKVLANSACQLVNSPLTRAFNHFMGQVISVLAGLEREKAGLQRELDHFTGRDLLNYRM